jgi:Fic family protein
MSTYKPPFHMTDEIVNRLAEISEQVGRITVLSHGSLNPHLRRENRIKTIHSSLAIEHNSLSLDQVTAILDGKRILGNPNEIREVKNAYDTYEMMLELDPFSVKDLLKAHKVMMQGLISENGRFRTGGVGIFDGEILVHMAPPADLVPKEIQDLFDWYQASEMHSLIKSAVFHYEFEFIHPFADGNGRIGRMWHSMLLGKWNELFYWLPVEELIRNRQQAYYNALGTSDRAADSAAFVELMLKIILDTLKETTVVGEAKISKTPKHQPNDVLDDVLTDRIMAVLKKDPKITQRDLAKQLLISYRSVQKYMKQLQEQGLIIRVGGKRYGHWEVINPSV